MTPSDPARTVALSTLSAADALRVEAICTRFEAACQAGERPSVDAYCAGVPEALLPVLRLELHALELAYSAPLFPGYTPVTWRGEGGMGIVYRARHLQLQLDRAIKVPKGSLSPRDRERFRFEAEVAASLEHPNIVPVYDVGEVHGLPFLTMKWIEGRTLAAALPELRGDLKKAVALLAKAARAVHHAHQRGLLHRDLKPANILLDLDNEPHVTDFGLARRLDASASMSLGEIAGTPAYMAPEQARGDRALSVAVDVYGLGAILYELLTGRPPFTGATVFEVLRKAQEETPPPPAALVPKVNRDLEAVCLKCLARAPAARYASAAELADDLERWVRGEGVSARLPDVWDWLRQVWRNCPPRASYHPESLYWLALIVVVTDLAMFLVVWLDLAAGWAWAMLALRVRLHWLNYRNRLARFGEVAPRERHSLIIGLAHLALHVALVFMYVPLNPWASSAGAVNIFPPLQAATGMALLIAGTTFWGRLLPVGLGLIVLSPLLAWLPLWAPLLHGLFVSAALIWWAECTRHYFMTEPASSPAGA